MTCLYSLMIGPTSLSFSLPLCPSPRSPFFLSFFLSFIFCILCVYIFRNSTPGRHVARIGLGGGGGGVGGVPGQA